MTIGDVISRIRNTVKGVNEDAFLTDRYIYSLYNNYGQQVMKEESDKQQKGGGSGSLESLYVSLPCVELVDSDKVAACCAGIKTNCTIKRTKDKLPKILEGASGMYLSDVTSIDGGFIAVKTDAIIYTRMTNIPSFKYNKNIYYWWLEGYLYFPTVEWDAVTVMAIFSEDVGALLCDGDACMSKQDQAVSFPEYLSGKIERMVLQDLGVLLQIPQVLADNSQSPLRST